MSPKSNFLYVKEFFVLKVRILIESLLFTAKVYSREKPVLLTKFRKPSEVQLAKCSALFLFLLFQMQIQIVSISFLKN